MSIDPCPTCKGNCCGYTLDLRHKDGHKGNPFHYCPDCDDGTYEICSKPEPFVPQRTYEQGIAEGERRERAATLAFLRVACPLDECEGCAARHAAADDIERGEHRREEEK